MKVGTSTNSLSLVDETGAIIVGVNAIPDYMPFVR